MKHHKRVVKKKPKFFDVESGSGTFTVGGGLQDATDEYVDYGDIHDPYSPYHPDDVIPSPSPSPDPNPSPNPNPNPDNHHNQDDNDDHGHHNVPPPGVSWSREQSLAVAASTLFGVGAGTALYYGYTAGRPPIGYADDPELPEIEMTDQPTGFSEFTVNGNGQPPETTLSEDIDAAFREQYPNATPEEMQGFDGVEQPTLADATADAEDSAGFWEDAWNGITGWWNSVEEATGDAVEMAENLPEIAGGAAEAATGSEAIAEAAEDIVAADEFVELAL